MTKRSRVGNQDGAKIRQLRKEAGLTVTALATRVGINPQSLSNIELGYKPAGLGVLIQIARELGQPVDGLIAQDAA